MEYTGLNGVKKGVVKTITVNKPSVFEATEPQISIDGNAVTATTDVMNTTASAHTAKIYLAIYSNSTNRFIGVVSSDAESFESNTADMMEVSMTMPSGVTSQNSYFKAFVWEGVAPVAEPGL